MASNIAITVSATTASAISSLALLRAELNQSTAVLSKFAKTAATSGLTPELSASMLQASEVVGETRLKFDALNNSMGEAHGHIGEIRELSQTIREMAAGNLAALPSTIARAVFGFGELSVAGAGALAGIVALGAGFVYLAEKANQAAAAERQALAASALSNNMVSDAGIKAVTAKLEQIPHVTADIAQKTVAEFASMGGMTNQIMTSLADNIDVLALATGKSLPEAAASIREFLAAPAQDGPKFIDALGASAAQVQKFMDAAKQGNASALSAGLDIFAQRMATVDSKAGSLKSRVDDVRLSTYLLMEQGDEFGQNYSSSLGIANKAASDFQKNVTGGKAADLAAAMRSAGEAAAALPPSLEQIRRGVESIGAESGRTKTQVVQDEITYLNASLATAEKTNASAEEQYSIQDQIAQKKVELSQLVESAALKSATNEKEAKLRAIEQEIAATQKGSDEQIALLEKLYTTAVHLDGAQSAQALDAAKQLYASKEVFATQALSSIAAIEAAAIADQNAASKEQIADIKQIAQEKQISASEEISQLADTESKRYSLTQSSLNTELALWAGYPDQLKEINKEIEANDLAHQRALADNARTGVAALTEEYKQAWSAPTLGPFAAVPAGAAALLVGAQAALVPSFDVGSNYVPSNMLAMVHQGERIIPAADNSALMAAVGAGGGQGGGQTRGDVHVHLNVNALDARSVENLFKSNGRAIAKSLSAQIRGLNSELRSAISSV